jgi:hypothetical protein
MKVLGAKKMPIHTLHQSIDQAYCWYDSNPDDHRRQHGADYFSMFFNGL